MIAKQMEHKKVVEHTRQTFNSLKKFSDSNEGVKNLNVNTTSDATNDIEGNEEACNKYVVQVENHSMHLNVSNLNGKKLGSPTN